MWTEINGKLPSKWGRREDLLTGNFFGLLQFASQESGILHEILKGVQFCFKETAMDNESKEAVTSYNKFLLALNTSTQQPIYDFWPNQSNDENGRDEIDLIIDFPGLDYMLGIEVKYLSHLSSNDDNSDINDNSLLSNEERIKHEEEQVEKSRNQILRYTRTFSKNYPKKTCFFLIWAKGAMATEIFEGITMTKNQNDERQGHSKNDIHIGFMSWEKTFNGLAKITAPLLFPDSKIHQDLSNYLTKKDLQGFIEFSIGITKSVSFDKWFIFDHFDFSPFPSAILGLEKRVYMI